MNLFCINCFLLQIIELTFDRFIVDFDFDIRLLREAPDIIDKFEILLVLDIEELGYREVGPISAIVDKLIRELERGV